MSSKSFWCLCVSLLPTGQLASSPCMPHPRIPSLALVMTNIQEIVQVCLHEQRKGDVQRNFLVSYPLIVPQVSWLYVLLLLAGSLRKIRQHARHLAE